MVQDTSEGAPYVDRKAAHPQSEDGWHRYRLPGTRIGLRVSYVILALALGVIFADYESHHGSLPVPLVLSSALVWVFFVVVVERVSVKTGLEECAAGFVDRQNFGSRLLLLEQVDCFDHRKDLTLNRAHTRSCAMEHSSRLSGFSKDSASCRVAARPARSSVCSTTGCMTGESCSTRATNHFRFRLGSDSAPPAST